MSKTKEWKRPVRPAAKEKLGFLRVIQVLFILNIFLTVMSLGFYSHIKVTSSVFVDISNLVFEGVLFWMIWKRKKLARYIMIVLPIANMLIGLISALANNEFDPLFYAISSSFDIILILYFTFSKRVRQVLVKPIDIKADAQIPQSQMNHFEIKTWNFWRTMIIFFCFFSVAGHWMEAGYCTLIRFGILPGTYDPNSQIWRDWLYPFCVYGVGACFCILIFYPLKAFLQKKLKSRLACLAISFVANAFVCTLIEFTMGMILNQPGPDGTYPLWDYTNMFCNFMGQVCLQNAIGFGIAATIMTWFVYPSIDFALRQLPNEVRQMIFIVILVFFAVLSGLYLIQFAADANLTLSMVTDNVSNVMLM